MSDGTKTLVVGLGHPYRSDDGFGHVAIGHLKEFYGDQYEYLQHAGDPADLIERWDQRCLVIIDALRTAKPHAGALHCFRPLEGEPMPAQKVLSSHALSLEAALELGQILGKMPKELVVLGVEGENFASGNQLTPAVSEAIQHVIHFIPTIDPSRNRPYA